MGITESRMNRQIQYEKERRERMEAAFALYQERLSQYNYNMHGNRHRYMFQIEAQYEMDCLPECVKQGSNLGIK